MAEYEHPTISQVVLYRDKVQEFRFYALAKNGQEAGKRELAAPRASGALIVDRTGPEPVELSEADLHPGTPC